MNPQERGKIFLNKDVVKAVGGGITPTFVNYLASRGLVDTVLEAKGQRTVYTYPESAVDQIRNFWMQKRQGINPAKALRNLGEPNQSSFFMGFSGDLSRWWNGINSLQKDPAVVGFSLLYGEQSRYVNSNKAGVSCRGCGMAKAHVRNGIKAQRRVKYD